MPSLIEVSAETAEIVPRSAAAVEHEQVRAADDDQLVKIWLHGCTAAPHIPCAPIAPISSGSKSGQGSRWPGYLSRLRQFAVALEELAPASRYRTLSAVKSLLAFGHRIGYLPFDVGRVLRLPAVRNRLAERILPEADLHRILSLESALST